MFAAKVDPSSLTRTRFASGRELWKAILSYSKVMRLKRRNTTLSTSCQVPQILNAESIISQYQRLANLYFLIVAIISTIPDVTSLNPAFIWTPLTIVLLISILK